MREAGNQAQGEKCSGNSGCAVLPRVHRGWDSPAELEGSSDAPGTLAVGHARELGATSPKETAVDEFCQMSILSHLEGNNVHTQNSLVGTECHLRVLMLQG